MGERTSIPTLFAGVSARVITHVSLEMGAAKPASCMDGLFFQ